MTEKLSAPVPVANKPLATPVINTQVNLQVETAPIAPVIAAPLSITVPVVVAPPETESENSAQNFDGNWRELVEKSLKLGLARALAQNCEMVSYDENSINLRVAANNKHLVSPNYQEKLSSAINQHFGKRIKLNVEISGEAHIEINTPAKQTAVEKATIQSSAEESIMQDSFVKDLLSQFDATIIPNSIKPIN